MASGILDKSAGESVPYRTQKSGCAEGICNGSEDHK